LLLKLEYGFEPLRRRGGQPELAVHLRLACAVDDTALPRRPSCSRAFLP